MLNSEELQALDDKLRASSDALICLGKKAWLKRRKKAKALSQEEQLRRIEDAKISDKAQHNS